MTNARKNYTIVLGKESNLARHVFLIIWRNEKMTYDTPFLKAPVPFSKISVTDGGLFLLTNGAVSGKIEAEEVMKKCLDGTPKLTKDF